MKVPKQGLAVRLIWATLVLATVVALVLERWTTAFAAVATLAASMVPILLAARMDIRLPVPFLTFTVSFLFATLFLGEAVDFYELLWWWDIVLHLASAVGFGLVGFLFVFFLFQGDRYAAPPWAVAFIAWCLAVSIGTAWEIFEFGMDQVFGLNMQKSGLVDTMTDLIVDTIGAMIGAASGFLYLKGRERDGLLAWLIGDFVRMNRKLYRRYRPARRPRR